MSRLLVLVLLAGFGLGAGTRAAAAAPAPDLFTVAAVKIDATAESATIARDQAMTQGRSSAWTQLFRRFTTSANWSKQPQLDDNMLLRMVRSLEVGNERRSTTRYLADVTFHFNPNAVRAALRQSGVAFTDTRSPPALVIPLTDGQPGFDPMSAWAAAWKEPSVQDGLVPFLLPEGDMQDGEVLNQPDLIQLDWAALSPIAERYKVGEIVVAIVSEDAKTIRMVEISPTGRIPASFAYAQSSFAADAEAVAEKAYETWKTRSAVNFGTRGRLTADVQFDSLGDWARIRSQLGAVRAIADMDVIGLALNEAEIQITYFGRPEQLKDALAQRNIQLTNAGNQFTLQLAGRSAANAP